jgi:hypothetical protein
MRTGRTNDLARRAGEHARHPDTRGLDFELVHHTDDPAARRGLEQMLHDQFSPPLDKINPISPTNPNRGAYMDAADSFVGGGGAP